MSNGSQGVGPGIPVVESKPKRRVSSRFLELDGLRAIAVLMVIVGHYTLTYDQLYPRESRSPFEFHYGPYGVQLFFLVSGFVILMTAERVKRASDFAITRLARLFPAYWIAVTWSILVALFLSPVDVATTWRDRIINYTMMQRWIGGVAVDTVYWTLAVEMQFYVFVFLILCISRCRFRGWYLWLPTVTWLAVSLVTALVFGGRSRGHSATVDAALYKDIFNAVLTDYAPLFCTGMFAFMARRGQRGAWVAALVGAGLSIIVAVSMHGASHAVVIAILCAIFLVVVALPGTPFLRFFGMQWVGRISYSLYLVHNVTGLALIHRLTPVMGRVPAMALAFVVSCALARLLYLVGEIHGTRLLRSALTRLRDGIDLRFRRAASSV